MQVPPKAYADKIHPKERKGLLQNSEKLTKESVGATCGRPRAVADRPYVRH